MVHQR